MYVNEINSFYEYQFRIFLMEIKFDHDQYNSMIDTNVLTIQISSLIDHHLRYNNQREIIENNFELLDKDYTRIFNQIY